MPNPQQIQYLSLVLICKTDASGLQVIMEYLVIVKETATIMSN